MNNWKLRHSFTGNATSDVQTVNGYLADPAYHLTTNLLLQSNQFDTTWYLLGITSTSGQNGYDGSTNAWKVEKIAASFRFLRQIHALSGIHTLSVYAKAGTLDVVSLFYRDATSSDTAMRFNLTTGQTDGTRGTTNFISADIVDAGNGWWRCSMTYNHVSGGEIRIYPDFEETDAGYIYIQDAQLEEGTQATTYVETTTEPVTLPDTFNVTVVPDGKEYAAPLFIPRTNLVDYSEDFTAWLNKLDTTIDYGYPAPDGTNTASKITQTGGHAHIADNFGSTIVTGVQQSIWARTVSGTGTVSLLNQYAIGSVTLTEEWQRFEAPQEGPAFMYAVDFRGAANTLTEVLIWGAQAEVGTEATEYIPTNGSAVTRDWSAFGRVQNQLPGICNGTHTHTGAASGSGIAATTITGSGSGATFAYDFDTLGVLTTLTADGAGSGYKVGDKLSIDTTEGHTIEFRLVEGSNAATVSVSMGAAKPNKPIPFPVSKMRVEGLTDRTVLFLDERSRYVFPKPTPYLLDTYEGAAAAYSLRRLRSSYTGPAVRVRRASNNDELDIYFNRDGSLDTATLEAFCAGTDGFVKVWFDQGQGGNDAEQTTTASQPKIVSSGSVVMENGEPALVFDGGDDFMTTRDYIVELSQNPASVFCVSQSNTPLISRYILSEGDSVSPYSSNFILGGAGVSGEILWVNGTTLGTMQAGQILIGFDWDETNATAFIDGSQSGISTPVSANTETSLYSYIGRNATTGAGTFFIGKIQELVTYKSDQSANREGIEDNINEYYGIYEFSGLLDDYSGAAAAYSLRRLSSTYTGPAIRVVKHDVGYPEMDIPFEDDGTLSVVLLEAFADGYDATIKVWYDQSNGSNDAEQSTLASQPKIVNAGTVIYENGLPAAQFDGADDYFTKAFTLTNPVSHFVVAQAAAINQFIIDGYGTGNRNSLVSPSTNNMRLFNGGSIIQPYTAGNQSLFSSISNGANSSLAVNGSNNTGTLGTNTMNGVTIGTVGTLASGYNLDGTIQEFIIYGSDQSANRTAIESNVNDFYSIYP